MEFRENGPGSVDHDMDKGIVLMKKYVADFEDLEKRRVQLGTFSHWFSKLSLTKYPKIF